ncbi:MAG: hypothetical protein K6F97_02120 [Lachnospiraceae bacterium]|nr:hypothetical protein [Lachnospiraceae bacterium]
MHALKRKNGYIFSKSVKTLPEKEKVLVLLPYDYHEIKNVNGDVMYKIKECIDDFEYEIDDEKNAKSQVLICGLALYFSSQLQKSGFMLNTVFQREKRASH